MSIAAMLKILNDRWALVRTFFGKEYSHKKKGPVLSGEEMEKLRMANIQSQLEALKQQINPHFLFNSLNVLDSLIEVDAPRARIFLEELSTAYRYLLRSDECHLVELANEVDFLRSYFHVQKTRLGDGLHLIIEIEQKYYSYLLPPFTIQLLIENAIAHNIVLPEQPLTITISTDRSGYLIVHNNLQLKKTVVISNGAGLDNILDKYRILKKELPTIVETDAEFLISIPMLANDI